MSGNSILFVVCFFVMIVIPEPSSSATTSRDLDVETTTVATISTTEIDSSTVTNVVTEDAEATAFKDLVELIDVSTTTTVTQAEEFDSGETLTTPPQIANDKPTEPIPDIDVISTVSKSESTPRVDSSDERSIQVYSTSEEVERSATLTSVDPDVDTSRTTSPSVASNEIKSRFDDEEGQIDPTPNSPSSGSGYFYEKPSIPFEFESQMSSQVDSFNGYDYPKPAKLFTYPSETDVNQINSDNFGGFYYY